LKCFGRKKNLKRCRNDVKYTYYPFCRHHRLQSLALIFTISSIFGVYAGIYQDAVKPFIGAIDTVNPQQPKVKKSFPVLRDVLAQVSPEDLIITFQNCSGERVTRFQVSGNRITIDYRYSGVGVGSGTMTGTIEGNKITGILKESFLLTAPFELNFTKKDGGYYGSGYWKTGLNYAITLTISLPSVQR